MTSSEVVFFLEFKTLKGNYNKFFNLHPKLPIFCYNVGT